jgi:Putative transposase
MSPLEFVERLAALVPCPRLHLIRFHGVLAPNAKLRGEIIPSLAEHATEHSSDHVHAQGASARMSRDRLLKRSRSNRVWHNNDYNPCSGNGRKGTVTNGLLA